MRTMQRFGFSTVVVVMFLGLSGCGTMSKQEKGTVIGAGAGAVGGAVLTKGSVLGTVGGAVVGGVVGHEVTKPKD